MHYLFRMLDMQHVGYLTPQTVQHFVESLQVQMLEYQMKKVDLEDVNKEIFNMVKPLDPSKITLQDLTNWYVQNTDTSVCVCVCKHICPLTRISQLSFNCIAFFLSAAARPRLWYPY